MTLAAFFGGDLIGWFSLIIGPLALIAFAWAATRTALVKAEREGRRTAVERLQESNRWNDELAARLADREKHLAECEAKLVEGERMKETLEERVDAQKQHMDKLLDWTPLFDSLERHSLEAGKHWQAELELLTKLEGLGLPDRLDGLEDAIARNGAILEKLEAHVAQVEEEVSRAVDQGTNETP